jgi:uncharacterized protein YdaU (DUF1376 family)
MSTRPWMPLYVNDFRLDTLDLKADEIGVYMLMLMLAWRRDDAALPNDMAWLKRSLQACTADFHGLTFNRIVPKLLDRYFELGQDGKWRNKRLCEERQKAGERSENQSRIARKRWSDYRHFNGLGHANGVPSQSHKKDSFLVLTATIAEMPKVATEEGRKENGQIPVSEGLAESFRRKGWIS